MHAQLTFMKTYKINDSSTISSNYALQDFYQNGDFLLGLIKDENSKNEASYWARADSTGTIKWMLKYYNNTNVASSLILATKDNGSLLSGTEVVIENGNYFFRPYIIKVDENGNKIWSRSIQSKFNSVTSVDLINDLDGGYNFQIGYDSLNLSNIGFLKLNENGEIIWQNSRENVYSYNVKQNVDSSYLTMDNRDYPEVNSVCIINKMEQMGHFVWSKKFNKANFDVSGSKIIITIDGGLVIVGVVSNRPPLPYIVKGLILKLNSKGEMEWSKTYSRANYCDGFESICNADDSSFVVIASSRKLDERNKGIISKIDLMGNVKWLKMNTSLIETIYFNVIKTKDKGFAINGLQNQKNSTPLESSYLLVKTDQDGNLGCFHEDATYLVEDIALEETDIALKITNTNFKSVSTNATLEFVDLNATTLCFSDATHEPKSNKTTINLFPNPVTNELNITVDKTTLPTGTKLSIDLVDGLGRILLSQNLDWDGHAIINTSELPPGWYAAVVSGDGHKLLAEKFVVMR